MIHKNVSLTIMFGLLLTFAGSRAFAGQDAYNQLVDATKAGVPNTNIAVVQGTADDALTGNKAATNRVRLAKDTREAAPPAVVPVPSASPAAKAESVSLISYAKEVIGKYKTHVVLAGLGAYLGFALFGPAGVVLGALFMVGVHVLSSM
jgi:hypothetical protein